jgi:hypothetical protein
LRNDNCKIRLYFALRGAAPRPPIPHPAGKRLQVKRSELAGRARPLIPEL